MAKAARPVAASNIPANGGAMDQLVSTPARAGNRPTRKAKQAALDQRVWANDLPATRKRALSSGTSTEPKKAKTRSNAAKSSTESNSTETVIVPPRFARKTNVLLAGDFDSSGEDDIPLSTASTRPAPEARSAVATSQKTTHVEVFHASCDDGGVSEEDPSDDNVDPEARDQAVAEQSESDDEVMASMEARGDADALSARLSAEQPMWSQPKHKGKAADRRVDSEDEKNDDEPVIRASKERKVGLNHGGEKKAAGLSKTALRAQQERPVFKTPASHTHVHSTGSNSRLPPTQQAAPMPPAPPAPVLLAPAAAAVAVHEGNPSDSDSDSDVELIDDMRPIDYQIVFPAQDGPLSLKAQHPNIQDAIQATITRLERKIVLEDAFPDAHKRGRGVRMTMVETVRELEPRAKYRSLLTRLITDAPFLKSLATIPNQRISSFRGKIKDRSNVSAPSFFGLAPGPEAVERVRWILPHLSYVYPADMEKRQVSDHLPYRAPIVVNVLRESFFKGTKSFFSRNEDIFTSSLPGRDEREIPLIMLALVGAAIHGSLMDWRSGDCVETSPFSADRYLDAYTEHKILLNAIKQSAPVKYHTMMYKLFNEASGAPTHVIPLGASAITHLNLDAMEED